MHALLTKRIEVPETWFDALMFAFKLPAIILPLWLLVWRVLLPPIYTQSYADYYPSMASLTTDDFYAAAFQMSDVFFLSALALVIGGFIQLLRYSSRTAGWSFGFSLFSLVLGIVLANASSPTGEVIEVLTRR